MHGESLPCQTERPTPSTRGPPSITITITTITTTTVITIITIIIIIMLLLRWILAITAEVADSSPVWVLVELEALQ